jgi:phosphoenolpyruvate phosphomutase
MKQGGAKAIVLAASRGSALGDLTADRPKCMLDIRGKPLLGRLVDTLKGGGIRDITVIRGYRKEIVNLPTVKTIDNDQFETTGEVSTLACAADKIKGETLLAYGDVLFREHIIDQITEIDGDIVLAVDALWSERDPDPASRTRDLVSSSSPFNTGYLDDEVVSVRKIGDDLKANEIDGEWIGVAYLSADGAATVRDELNNMSADGSLEKENLTDLFTRLLARNVPIQILYIAGQWLDIDNPGDLKDANSFL